MPRKRPDLESVIKSIIAALDDKYRRDGVMVPATADLKLVRAIIKIMESSTFERRPLRAAGLDPREDDIIDESNLALDHLRDRYGEGAVHAAWRVAVLSRMRVLQMERRLMKPKLKRRAKKIRKQLP